jgi:hypothetical protein
MKIAARCVWLILCPLASGRLSGQGASNTISGDTLDAHWSKSFGLKLNTTGKVKKGDEPVVCGSVPSYKNAKPKDYKDARPTKYDSETKKTVPVTFKAGDTIPFKCDKGYTTDGSKDGETTYDVTCKESGFYEPAKVCVKASPCGELPKIKFAAATGKTDDFDVQYKCNNGYSLDGEKVVAGGMGKNSIFMIKCDAFAGKYKEFEGKCKPYGFVPAGEMVKGYNLVFEALFCASCESTLRKKFGGDQKPPKDLDKVCDKVDDSSCSGLVSEIKADFEKQAKALKDHKKDSKKDWMETDDEAPGIKDEAKKFCKGVWKAISMPGL